MNKKTSIKIVADYILENNFKTTEKTKTQIRKELLIV